MNQNQTHISFLEKAIEKSRESLRAGNFPAGAIVVKDGIVISEAVSSPFPSLFHADSKAVTSAFEKYGDLTDATLYVGLENCLMCLGVTYWAGIRNIYFAVPKSKVSHHYYETSCDTSHLPASFNTPIHMHHIESLEKEALLVIQEWEASL